MVTLTFHEVWPDPEGVRISSKVQIDSIDLPECLREIVNVITYKFEINLDKGNLDISEIVKTISDNKATLYKLCMQNSQTQTTKLNY